MLGVERIVNGDRMMAETRWGWQLFERDPGGPWRPVADVDDGAEGERWLRLGS